MTAQPMDPKDVPDALARAAVEGYYGHTIPDGGFAVLRGQWQRALAAVIPLIRAQVADEIDQRLDEQGDGSEWDNGMMCAAEIARGDQ